MPFFPLLLISLPGVPKYDGVRLFLPAFPFLAILSGLGLEWLVEKVSSFFQKRLSLQIAIHLPLFLGLLFLGINARSLVSIRPYYLSYFNSLVGGVRGGKRIRDGDYLLG